MRVHSVIEISAWVLVVCMGLFAIASIYLAIWQWSDKWALTAFVSIFLAIFSGIGASALIVMPKEKP